MSSKFNMSIVVWFCTVDDRGYSQDKKTLRAHPDSELEVTIRAVELVGTQFRWYTGTRMVPLRQGSKQTLLSDVCVAGMPLALTGKPVRASGSKLLLLPGDLLLSIMLQPQCDRVKMFAVCREIQHVILSGPRSDLALRVKSMHAPFAFFGVLQRIHARYNVTTLVLRELEKWGDETVFALEHMLMAK